MNKNTLIRMAKKVKAPLRRFKPLRHSLPYLVPGVAGLLERIEPVRRRLKRIRTLDELERRLPPNEIEHHGPCLLCTAEQVRIRHRSFLWGYRAGRCPRCGLLYRVPAIKPERVPDLYKGGEYAEFLEGGYRKGRRAQYQRTMDAFDPLFADADGRRLLDFGCGTGIFLELARTRGFDAFGLDLSPHAVELANERLGAGRAWCGHPLEVPEIAAGGFDVITMWSVLAHFAEPVRQLEEIRALLNPGGALLIYTVNAQSLELKAYGGAWACFNKNHLIFWEPTTLSPLLRRVGFEGVTYRPFYGSQIETGKGRLTKAQRARIVRHIDRYESGPMMRAVAVNGPVEQARLTGVHRL